MKTSAELDKFATAFSKAQGMMGNASKDAKNPFFKSSYATLASVIEAIREPFSINGLSFLQPCKILEDGSIHVETMILHSSGQYIVGELTGKPVKPDPQSVGSLVSYLKRYALQAMVGIASADDDAEAASGRHPQQERPKFMLKPNSDLPPALPKLPSKPEVDELTKRIQSLIKQLTNDFKDKEKMDLIFDEIKARKTEQIQALSNEQKLDIVSLLESKLELK